MTLCFFFKVENFHFLSTDPSMANIKDALFQEIAAEMEPKANNKVTIVGIGAVGMAAAFSILAQVNENYFLLEKKSSKLCFS